MKQRLYQFAFQYGALVFIGLVILFFALSRDAFFTFNNVMDILRAISIVTFVAIGVTISLMVDGFDLSVGATVSLSTVLTASLMVWYEMPLVVVLIAPLLVGAAIGLFNALLIVKIRIPDLLATLAVMYTRRGCSE